jgi:RNA polymerase sigma-70 factor (ECF subfamily)
MSATLIIRSDKDISVSHQSVQATGLWQRWFGKPQNVSVVEAPYLAAARAGDPDALALFYAEHQPAVWRLCRRLLRREADAEDAVQSAFVKAFAALPRFRGEANLKTWLYRIAVNEAMNLLRKREAVGDEGDAAESDLTAPGGMSDAERIAIRSMMGILKPDHRTILALRYWEDLSYEEIAEVLNVPLPSVKMRLHRAKAEFKRLYCEEGVSTR